MADDNTLHSTPHNDDTAVDDKKEHRARERSVAVLQADEFHHHGNAMPISPEPDIIAASFDNDAELNLAGFDAHDSSQLTPFSVAPLLMDTTPSNDVFRKLHPSYTANTPTNTNNNNGNISPYAQIVDDTKTQSPPQISRQTTAASTDMDTDVDDDHDEKAVSVPRAPSTQHFESVASDIACLNDDPFGVFQSLQSIVTYLLRQTQPSKSDKNEIEIENENEIQNDTTMQQTIQSVIEYEGVQDFLRLLGYIFHGDDDDEDDDTKLQKTWQYRARGDDDSNAAQLQTAMAVLNGYEVRLSVSRYNSLYTAEQTRDADTVGGVAADGAKIQESLSLEQILMWSTHESIQDKNWMDTLLLTHQQFTTSLSLFRHLRHRFESATPFPITPKTPFTITSPSQSKTSFSPLTHTQMEPLDITDNLKSTTPTSQTHSGSHKSRISSFAMRKMSSALTLTKASNAGVSTSTASGGTCTNTNTPPAAHASTKLLTKQSRSMSTISAGVVSSISSPYGALSATRTIQLKVMESVCTWMEHFWDDDFQHVEELQQELASWLQQLQRAQVTRYAADGKWMQPMLKRMLSVLEENRSLSGKRRQRVEDEKPNPLTGVPRHLEHVEITILKRGYKLSNVTADVLADQITLMNFRIYGSVGLRECIGQKWKKQKCDAPNIMAMIEEFNHLVTFVQLQVLWEEGLRARGKELKLMIQMGERFKKLRNYNALCAVTRALDSTPIFRLRHAWQKVPQKYVNLFRTFKNLFQRTHNFRTYRSEAATIQPPAIPYFALFLQDLMFIDEGVGVHDYEAKLDATKDNELLVNFNKWIRTMDRVRSLRAFQSVSYEQVCKPQAQLQRLLYQQLHVVKDFDEDTIFAMSEEAHKNDEKAVNNSYFSAFRVSTPAVSNVNNPQ